VANTTFFGKVDTVPFKNNGKVIPGEGWRVVLKTPDSKIKKRKITPQLYRKGKRGLMNTFFLEKEPKHPSIHKATLLREWKRQESK